MTPTRKNKKKRENKGLHLKGEYCCDFETTSKAQYEIEGRTRVYLYKWVSLLTGEGKYGLSLNEFIEDIKLNEDMKKIYFHNLSFDGTFIINFLLENNYKYTEKVQNDKEFSCIIDNFGSIYYITLGLGKRIIEFMCSYKLTGLSIKDLGKLVGLDKLNETHDYQELKNYKSIEEIRNTNEELQYIDNDVEIQRRGIIECYKMGLRGMTKSSACFKLWRNMSFVKVKGKIGIKYTAEVEHIVNSSYRGGITQMNPLYANKVIENCRDYDVNSLYPSVMYNPMPVGEPIVSKNEKDIPNNYSQRLYMIYVWKAKIIDPYIPFIPTQKTFIYKESYDYKKSFENVELCLWEEELELFKLFYDSDYQVIKIVAFKSQKDLFSEYLNIFKEIKENAPNPSPERTFAKLCMNSLYGKFAQSDSRISKKPYLDEDGNVKYEPFISECKGQYSKAIASKITSLARCVLIKAINKDPSRFLYCDTDSIYVKGDYEYDIPTDPKKLGYWKYENSYYKFKGLKAKCYISTIKGGKEDGQLHSAVAGLPKDAQQQLTYETFNDGLVIEDAKKCMKRVKGGIIIDTISFTIKINKQENAIIEG